MRIGHYLENHATLQTVLKIVVDEIRKTVISCSPTAKDPQIGAISFIQHFGNTLTIIAYAMPQPVPIGIVHEAAIACAMTQSFLSV